MPPSATSTGSLKRSVDRASAACRTPRRSAVRCVSSDACADAGAAREPRPARRRARRAPTQAADHEASCSRRGARAGSSSQTTTSPTKSSTCCASPNAAVLPDSDVEQRRADEARDQRGDHRQQTGDARRASTPRSRNPTASATSNEPRWRGGVHRQPGVGPEHQRGDRDRDLRQRDRDQDPPQREVRVGVRRRPGPSAPMAARMPGARSGMAGAGDEPDAVGAAPRRRARRRGSRRTRRGGA